MKQSYSVDVFCAINRILVIQYFENKVVRPDMGCCPKWWTDLSYGLVVLGFGCPGT